MGQAISFKARYIVLTCLRSSFPVSSAFSRIIFGVLVDANTRLTPFLSFISCLGSSISVLALWGLVAGTAPGLIAFSVVFGIFSGGYSTLYAGMIRQVGSESSSPFLLPPLLAYSALMLVSPLECTADSPAQTATLYGVFAFVRGIGNVLAAPVCPFSTRLFVSIELTVLLSHSFPGFHRSPSRRRAR